MTGGGGLGGSMHLVVRLQWMHRAGPPREPSVPESASQSRHPRPTDGKRGGAQESVSPGEKCIHSRRTHAQKSIRGKEGLESSVQSRSHQLSANRRDAFWLLSQTKGKMCSEITHHLSLPLVIVIIINETHLCEDIHPVNEFPQ